MLIRVEHEKVLLLLGQFEAYFIIQVRMSGDKCLQSCHFEGRLYDQKYIIA